MEWRCDDASQRVRVDNVAMSLHRRGVVSAASRNVDEPIYIFDLRATEMVRLSLARAMALRENPLDTFRSEWVCGHLDYQRAADELETTRRIAGQLRSEADVSSDEVRRADEDVENARRRLSEVGAVLAKQFDRFCGVGE